MNATYTNLNTYLLQNEDLTVNLSSGRNRPGFTIPYTITVSNRGKETLTTNVSVLLGDELTYISLEAETLTPTVDDQNLSWETIEVTSGETKRIYFYAILDRETTLGTVLESEVNLDLTDDVAENNVNYYSAEVTGSFDPNDKAIKYNDLDEDGYITSETSFEYTIRFQNTGTDTAFTVMKTYPSIFQLSKRNSVWKSILPSNVLLEGFTSKYLHFVPQMINVYLHHTPGKTARNWLLKPLGGDKNCPPPR